MFQWNAVDTTPDSEGPKCHQNLRNGYLTQEADDANGIRALNCWIYFHLRSKKYFSDFLTGVLPSVLWHCWSGVRKSIRHVEIEWWGVGVVICLQRDRPAPPWAAGTDAWKTCKWRAWLFGVGRAWWAEWWRGGSVDSECWSWPESAESHTCSSPAPRNDDDDACFLSPDPRYTVSSSSSTTSSAPAETRNSRSAVTIKGGSVAEWLACWTQAQMAWVQIAAATRHCRVTVLGKRFTPIVPLFTKQRNL